jgi:alpha-tubulin suppressor-like RCC1 family protein
VTAGGAHTCGVTTDNRAFCWGNNRDAQIGDRAEYARRRVRPTLVADGHAFRQLDAGRNHTCGVTTDRRAWCWGNGRYGQFGNGKAYLSFWPRAVAGGLFFDRVTAGAAHSCGETTLNRAYCWGSNVWGQLGDGSGGAFLSQRLTPVAVSGGLFFSQVSAGDLLTCGRTDAGVAYCWGRNVPGGIGDGTTETRLAPVPVASPM